MRDRRRLAAPVLREGRAREAAKTGTSALAFAAVAHSRRRKTA
jgi:hypothetical protein